MVLGDGACTAGGTATGAGAGAATAGGASGAGLTVVTVSAGSAPLGGAAAGVDAAAGAEVCSGAVEVGEVPLAVTEPLSPPPRMMPVVPMAMNRITPAIPAIHIHRRSMLSSS